MDNSKQPPIGAISDDQSPVLSDADRRGFIAKLSAVVIGGFITIFPFAAGLFTWADPLRRRADASGSGDGFTRVANLDALPDDGVPRQFAVLANRTDAWNEHPNQAIGAVYLRRVKGSQTVEAFNAICPHAGCFVGYSSERNLYQCPCHNSAFKLDGAIIAPSPSARAMDSLTAEVRAAGQQNEVWVKFENFYSNRAKKIVKT